MRPGRTDGGKQEKRVVACPGGRVSGSVARLIVSLAVVVTLVAQATPSVAADVGVGARDYDVANGHFYEQASSKPGHGFVVSDDDGVPLWREFQRLGGTQAVGYPISRRYPCDEAVCQAFERAIFKWAPKAREVELLSIFDWLHLSGEDAWLDERWGVPPWNAPDDVSEAASKNDRAPLERADQRAMLEANPLIQAAYEQSGPLAATLYGSARSYRAADGRSVLRTQRAVFVQPDDAPGQVQILSAGRVFADAGLVPNEVLEPTPAQVALDDTPPVRIKIPDLGIDASVMQMDMGADDLLPVPTTGHDVAWYSYGARLGAEGNAVLSGHVDWNRERGVFWSLREAQPGQIITLVSGAGRVYEYRVDWAKSFVEDSAEGLLALRSRVGGTTITLVTCTGRFDARTRSYLDRHIVRATLVARRGPVPAG